MPPVDVARAWLLLGCGAVGAACAAPGEWESHREERVRAAMNPDAQVRLDSGFMPGGEFPDEPEDAGTPTWDALSQPDGLLPPPEPPSLVCSGGFKLAPLAGFESYTALGGAVVGMDADGSGYVVGEYNGTLDLGPSALPGETGDASPEQANHGFVAKFDAECRVAWVRRLGPASAGVRPLKGALDERGRLFVAGTFEGVTPFQADMAFTRGVFVSRLDGDGNTVFTRSYASHRQDVGADVLDIAAHAGVVLVTAIAGEDADFGAGTGQFGAAYGHGGITLLALTADGNPRLARPSPGAFPMFVEVGGAGDMFCAGRGVVPPWFGASAEPAGQRVAFAASLDSRGAFLDAEMDSAREAVDVESSHEHTLIGADQTHDWVRFFPGDSSGTRAEVKRWTADGARLPDLRIASAVLPYATPHLVGNRTGYWMVGTLPERDHCQVFTVTRHDSYGAAHGSLTVRGCSTAQVTGAVSAGPDMLAFSGVVSGEEGVSCPVPAESHGFVYARVLPP